MAESMKKFGVFVALIGCIVLCVGFYKKSVYEEPARDNNYKGVNVYVEGDAYNYCINAGYFVGYSVIGGAFIVVGGVLFAAGAICEELGCVERVPSSVQSASSRTVHILTTSSCCGITSRLRRWDRPVITCPLHLLCTTHWLARAT
ncbi:MAG: hypothetical protein IIT65_11610 [Lachnospiraceae bacterium]|nr:hypothetical protein [Lachnospiraceae bacterium]